MAKSKQKLLLATRKGLVVYERSGSGWRFREDHFLGIPVSIIGVDSRNGSWWAMQDHGHWGCKLHRSNNEGKNWQEIEVPKYPEGEEIKDGVPATLKYLWAFATGGPDQNGRLYIGTDPGGLFVSDDNGDSFTLNRLLWDREERKEHWFGGGRDNPGIHSIVVDPGDNDHLYIAISCAGVYESRDGGQSWQPRNKGLRAEFLPDPNSEIGHDVHRLIGCQNHFDILWQQNHCGVYRSTDAGANWNEVSQNDGPVRFGFSIAVDDDDPDVAWVIPAWKDEYRVAVDRALQVCRTDDGGKTWQSFTNGLPQENCYDLVFRHAFTVNGDTLAFGSTTGNVFISENRGESWECLNRHLPTVYACEIV